MIHKENSVEIVSHQNHNKEKNDWLHNPPKLQQEHINWIIIGLMIIVFIILLMKNFVR